MYIINPAISYDNCFNILRFMILTVPRYVRVSTEYEVVHFDDGNSGSLSITLGVECHTLPTICQSMVTPHKPTQGRVHEDRV